MDIKSMEVLSYSCITCRKDYGTYKNLWAHNKNDRYNSKYHEHGLIQCTPGLIGSTFFPVFLFVISLIVFKIFCKLFQDKINT